MPGVWRAVDGDVFRVRVHALEVPGEPGPEGERMSVLVFAMWLLILLIGGYTPISVTGAVTVALALLLAYGFVTMVDMAWGEE